MDAEFDLDDAVACLGCARIFKGLGAASMRQLALSCSWKRIPKGYVLFREGDTAEQVYVIMHGAVAEYTTGPNELEVIVKELKRGDYLGEIGVLVDEPHYVTAIARRSTAVVVIPRNEFLSRLKSEPSISQILVKTLAHRLLLAARHSIAFANLDAPTRLAYLILNLERQEGSKRAISVFQDDLARRCGLARQTVARILGGWREAGWLSTTRGRLENIDAVALGRLVSLSEGDPRG